MKSNACLDTIVTYLYRKPRETRIYFLRIRSRKEIARLRLASFKKSKIGFGEDDFNYPSKSSSNISKNSLQKWMYDAKQMTATNF